MRLRAHYHRQGRFFMCKFFMDSGLVGTMILTADEFNYMHAEYPEWDWYDDEQREAA